MDYRAKKIGILGGGQLGRMIYEAILKWDLDIHYLDKDRTFPVGKICPDFVCGDFNNYDDVVAFGADKDVITIEIEAVNLEALKFLEKQGKTVHPRPAALKIIKDKGLQKLFYESQEIPSSAFHLYEDKAAVLSAIEKGDVQIPFVQKARTGGYDGKGVTVIKSSDDFQHIFDTPSVVEDMVEIDKEIGVIIARNENGEIKVYDPVEMVFDDHANLVDYLFAPAAITSAQDQKLKDIAIGIVEGLDICGLLAVEFFLSKSGEILVNEVAPRAHNSGHHSIEACITSQFEQHIRGVLNMPLGSTQLLRPAVMVNILGEEGSKGKVQYKGVDECLTEDDVHIHLYGKTDTKPFRKMGHITVLDQDLDTAKKKAQYVKKQLIATT